MHRGFLVAVLIAGGVAGTTQAPTPPPVVEVYSSPT